MIDLNKLPARQRDALARAKLQGYAVVGMGFADAIRVTRHNDNRVIMADGSQKRAQHQVTKQRPRGFA